MRKMCENWGYERLHQKVRERSIDEMKDADELIGHILYLEGVPNVAADEYCARRGDRA